MLLFSIIAFWKLLELWCCAPSLQHSLIPSAPSCAFLAAPFARQHVELSTSSSGSQKRFQLVPFSQGSKQSTGLKSWVLQVLLRANEMWEISCWSGACMWLQLLAVLWVSLAHDLHPKKWEQCPPSAWRTGLSALGSELSPGLSLCRLTAFPVWHHSLLEHSFSAPSFLLSTLLGSGCVFVFSPRLSLFHLLPRIIRGLLKGCC